MTIRKLGASNNANSSNESNQNQNRNNDNAGRRNESEHDRESIRNSFGGIRNATKNVFGERSNPTRALSSLATYAADYIKSKVRDKNSKWDVVIVENGVAVPSVVVVSLTEGKNASDELVTTVVGHAIMLVDYDRRPQSLADSRIGSTTYNEPTVWADALDGRYFQRIEDALSSQLELKKFQYVKGGCTTISFNEIPTDKLNTNTNFQDSKLDNLIFTVMTGIDSLRQLANDDYSTNLRPEFLDSNSSIIADINLNVNSSKTPTGLPVAEDFMIRVRETKNNRYSRDHRDDRIRSLNDLNENSEEAYGAVSGRIDFSIVESELEKGVRDPRIEDAACAIPEFVIANFDIYDRSPSLPLLLQLISSVGILDTRNPRIYLQAFNPANIINTPSRNLGALNAELQDIKTGKFLERVEFRSNTNDDTIRKFSRGAIKDLSRLSLEVPSQGPLAAMLDIFHKAAEYAIYGGENLRAYNDMIINAANILTDNAFGDIWNSNDAVMINEIQTIPGGYWMDETGDKRDTREFGYLYYANLENPKEALDMSRDYVGTFYEEDPIVAAANRRNLIDDIKGKDWVQTDNFKRVTFNPEFIFALNDALRHSGLAVQTPNMNFGGRGDERRRVDDRRGYINSDRLNNGYTRYREDRGYNRNNSYRRDNTGMRRNFRD